jgi:hypothetical protein
MNRELLKLNPELARNFKLELTSQRLVLMPVILVLLAGLILSFGGNDFSMGSGWNDYDKLCQFSLIAFLLITGIWGAKSAADGILDEYNNKTWDWQRMSTISPMKMTIGKLFGSTIYNWYGGIICLFIYFVSSILSNHHSMLVSFVSMLNVILTAIALQGFTILSSLMQIRKGDGRRKIKSTSAIFLAIFGLSFIVNGFNENQSRIFGVANNLYWYKINFGIFGSLLSPVFFCSWIVAGLYRSFRTEFQYENGLKWWVIFLISLAIYLTGYFVRPNYLGIEKILVASAIAASIAIGYFFITWIMAMAEPKEFIPIREALLSWKNKNYRKFYTQAPLWLVGLIFSAGMSVLTCIVFLMCRSSNGSSAYLDQRGDFLIQAFFDQMNSNIAAYALVPIAAFFFLLRDVSLILLINLSGKRKRADGTALLLLVVLYVIAPALVRDSNIEWIFYPLNTEGNFLMLLSPFLQASMLIYYLVLLWRNLEEKHTENLS